MNREVIGTAGTMAAAIPVAAGLLTMILWSGTAVANRYAVFHVDAITVAVVRSMIAGLIALCLSLFLRLRIPRSRQHQALLVFAGVSSFAAWPVCLSLGLARTSATHAGLIMAMLPIFTVLISSFVNRTWPERRWWWGSILAFAGAAALIARQDQSVVPPGQPIGSTGDLIILLGCTICAAGYVAGGRLAPEIGAPATTFWGLSSALVVLVPLFLLRDTGTVWSSLPASAWLSIAWLALFSSLLGYALWFFALGRGGISKIASLQLLLPVMTMLAAIAVLGEQPTLPLVAICLLIVAGTYVAHRHAATDRR